MSELYFISDLHLNHAKLVEPQKYGQSYRPFTCLEHMNETIINNINGEVTDKDRLYILGDVVFQKASSEHLLARIKGKKTLIVGNHDEITKNSYYIKYFKEILVWQQFEQYGFVCSHIPLHPSCFRGSRFNLHGHLHKELVLKNDGKPDTRYLNVCVERTNYKPLHVDRIIDVFNPYRQV